MGDTALGIDIGSHSVKAVLLRRRGGGIQIVRAGRAMLEELGHMGDSRRKVTKEAMIVRNLLRSTGISSRPARIAVAGRKSIIRYTRVPPAPAWRLKMLIDYEIEGDTEGKSQELAYDFRLLDLPVPHLEFTVMMAMARNELVESHCEIMDEAGVPVDNVTLTPFPVFNTYVQSRGDSLEDDKTTLLVDIGSENLNVAVQRNGKLFFARNISPGARAFTEAVQDEFRLPFAEAEELKCTKGRLLMGSETGSDDETQISPSPDAPTEVSGPDEGPVEMVDDDLAPQLSTRDADLTAQLSEAMIPVAGRIASAIQSSLMYCRAQTRMPELEIDLMVLSGGGAKLPGVRQALSRRLGIPAVPADPLKGLDLSPLKREMREGVEADAEGYTTAIGLALSRLSSDAVDFCLLPRKIKERRRFLAKTVYLWLSGAAMLVAMVLVGFSSWRNTNLLEDHVNELEQRYADHSAAKASKDRLFLVDREYRDEIKVMDRVWRSPKRMVAALQALTLRERVRPPVVLTKFSVVPPKTGNGPKEVIIEGYVLRMVELPGGEKRELDLDDAHGIIGKLIKDLRNDPLFDRPPDERIILREVGKPGTDHAAEFKLRFVLAEDKQ